jgi:DNA-binding Lrp family transcriptional regulator
VRLDDRDRDLLALLADGLALVPRPYAELGARLGLDEAAVMIRLTALLEAGVLRRLGVIVNHHALGYRANAMVVWDLPDERIDIIGKAIGEQPFVTLCYRRPRRPGWPYNLFSMIHGRDRDTVMSQLAGMIAALGLEGAAHEVLFSRRRFKQKGARYRRLPATAEGQEARR